jgi:hypothetical protein
MYGATGGAGPSTILTINLATGAGTAIGGTGIAQCGALAFGTNDVLYCATSGAGGGQIYTINTATGAATMYDDLSGFITLITGMAQRYTLVAATPTE